MRQPSCAFLLQGSGHALLQGDGEEEEGTTESAGEGGVMMGGPTRRRHRKGRHYDAKDDVILRLEALQPQEVKVWPADRLLLDWWLDDSVMAQIPVSPPWSHLSSLLLEERRTVKFSWCTLSIGVTVSTVE